MTKKNDKILFVILTCNRYYYFRNCIESIFNFVDMNRIDILVCDNNTIEPGFDEYAEKISSKYPNVKIKKFSDRNRNELYRAMNYAIKRARKGKYNIINFIQDDYQYLFKNDRHLDEAVRLFKKNKYVAQINYNLVWKRKHKSIGKIRYIATNNINYAVLRDKRTVDCGFTRLAAYDKTGLYPTDAVSWGGTIDTRFSKHPDRYKGVENGEVWFGRECKSRGWFRAISLYPNMTMLFDCAFVRGNIRMGRYISPKEDYYIRPFSEKDIRKIKDRHNKRKFCFIEGMCEPDGWRPQTYGKHSTADIVNDVRSSVDG